MKDMVSGLGTVQRIPQTHRAGFDMVHARSRPKADREVQGLSGCGDDDIRGSWRIRKPETARVEKVEAVKQVEAKRWVPCLRQGLHFVGSHTLQLAGQL